MNEPDVSEFYSEYHCKHCSIHPKLLKQIRRAFEKDVRSFLMKKFPGKVIEGTEYVDGELMKCWYEYQTVVDNNQGEFLN